MPQIIINDENYHLYTGNVIVDGEAMSRGMEGMFQRPDESYRGFEGLADYGVTMIPESEWGDRIREQDRLESHLEAYINDMKLPCKDQNGTNYCWIFGVTGCAEVMNLRQTGQCVSLSPASGGAQIKNYRNVGGWGDEALDWIVEHGLNLSEDWPDTAINRRYATRENKEKALNNRAVEYFKLRSWQEVVSCVLNQIPVAAGYNWWRHLVYIARIMQNLDARIRNSWKASWGENGFATLAGRKKFPDGAVAIVTTTLA